VMAGPPGGRERAHHRGLVGEQQQRCRLGVLGSADDQLAALGSDGQPGFARPSAAASFRPCRVLGVARRPLAIVVVPKLGLRIRNTGTTRRNARVFLVFHPKHQSPTFRMEKARNPQRHSFVPVFRIGQGDIARKRHRTVRARSLSGSCSHLGTSWA
jgi:hypothetical protein